MRSCPACQSQNDEESRFCGECGTPLAEKNEKGCGNCHAPAEKIDQDGFCAICGCERPPNPDARETALSDSFAGASDKGKRHFQNEDVFEIGACNGFFTAVVCDGVSTSARPAEASRLAAEAARDQLRQSLPKCNGNALTKVIEDAIEAAETVVHALPANDPKLAPPASTIVVAIVGPDKITVGWLGDSRAYFVNEKKSKQITRDHSWVNQQVDEAGLSYAEASKSRMAHTITKTLGGYRDSDQPDQPSFAEFDITEPGWFIVCSDGLWNYTETINEVIALAGKKPTAQELATFLVHWANEQGGKDNITVTAMRVRRATKNQSTVPLQKP